MKAKKASWKFQFIQQILLILLQNNRLEIKIYKEKVIDI